MDPQFRHAFAEPPEAARPPVAPGSLHWGTASCLFALHSSSPVVLRRASVVLRPWLRPHADGPLLGSWRIRQGDDPGEWLVSGDTTAARPESRGDAASAVACVEFLAARALFETDGPTAFHAALVSRGGRGVLVCGPTGSGKSTLAWALWQRGFSLLSDDTAIVDEASGHAWGAPRRVSLRAGSRALLGEDEWRRLLASPAGEPSEGGCLFHPDELTPGRERRTHLVACVFLARQGARPPAPGAIVDPLAAAHVALALLPYSNLARRLDMGSAIARIAACAAAVRAVDLARAPLPAMIEAVEQLLEGRSA